MNIAEEKFKSLNFTNFRTKYLAMGLFLISDTFTWETGDALLMNEPMICGLSLQYYFHNDFITKVK